MQRLQQLITFKEEERYIYDEIQKHSGKGNWVKDILAEHIKNQQSVRKIKKLYQGRRD